MLKSRAGTPRVARTGAARRPPRALAGASLVVAGVVWLPPAYAADAHDPGLPEVVVGATPLPGLAVAIDALPGEVRSL